MAEQPVDLKGRAMQWRTQMDLTTIMAILAFAVSGLSFYRSYMYVNQQLEVTVTEVSYVTNEGGLYMTVAFSNGGNRDGALLRAEPALWMRRTETSDPEWVPLSDKVDPSIPVTAPATPLVVKAGGVEVLKLSTSLAPALAERALDKAHGGAFLGIRVSTMAADGNLYLLEHVVARLVIDAQGRIQQADAAIHQSLSAFSDVRGAPPGDRLQSNKKTPFVWADQHY
jgi:hypothetical protein